MRILMACGSEGLLEYRDRWQQLPCPLTCPSLLALGPGGLAAADAEARQLWTGGAPCAIDSGLEALVLWRQAALTLSADTDSLTLLDPRTGVPQLLSPAGVCPQDLCLVGERLAAVCGGMDGKLRLMSLPELRIVRELTLPGFPQRIVCAGDQLTVLCLTGEDAPRSLVCRADLSTGQTQAVCALAGLPGALCSDNHGGIWLGVSERVLHMSRNEAAPDLVLPGFGLPQHLSLMGARLLVSDPVLGMCAAVDAAGHMTTLYLGDVRHAMAAD